MAKKAEATAANLPSRPPRFSWLLNGAIIGALLAVVGAIIVLIPEPDWRETGELQQVSATLATDKNGPMQDFGNERVRCNRFVKLMRLYLKMYHAGIVYDWASYHRKPFHWNGSDATVAEVVKREPGFFSNDLIVRRYSGDPIDRNIPVTANKWICE